jgi:polysaccharide biosynthesis/export protein
LNAVRADASKSGIKPSFIKMKNVTALVLSALFFSTASWSQEPRFREAQPTRTAAPSASPQGTDDSNSAASHISSMEALDDTIPLRVGYRLSLRIVEDKEKTLSLLVQDSGDIVAPHLGLVRAAGLTCKKVAFNMKRELEKQYFQQATVIVSIESIPRNLPGQSGPGMVEDFFTVFGQVARQGKYEMFPDEELTVSHAILKAGGFAPFASTKDVRIIRKVKTEPKPVEIKVNVDEIMTRGRLEHDIVVRPNDVIIVKEKKINF